MSDQRLAFFILSLTASPEDASAILGDCLELAPSQSRIWFWKSILRIAAAHALTQEGRKSMSLLPALLDTSVYTVSLCYMLQARWIESPFYFAAFLAVSIAFSSLMRRIFPAWRLAAHGMARIACSIAITSAYLLFF